MMPQASFSFVRELASGGMGRVDIVVRREGGFERLYACKRLHTQYRDDPYFRGMFLDEARVAGLLRHGNVVSVLDVGEDDEGPYLLMDFIEGVAMHELIRGVRRNDDPLPVQLCLSICAQIADGLHAAHELETSDGRSLQLVHRDVSPQNVIVGYDGIVRLTDFGIAKAFGQSTRTQTGMLKGKLGYMSPEQLRFEEPDRRSDLFALGIVLYELLSGERLYRNAEGMDGTRRLLDEPPPDIGEVRPDVPIALVELSFELLAKSRDDRPSTALEVARRLEAARAETIAEEGALELADFVTELFADKRDAQRTDLNCALQQQRERAEQPVAPTAQEPPRKWLAAGAVLAIATGGVAAFTVVRSQAEPLAPPEASSPQTTAEVTLVLDSDPSDAVVRIAGTPRGRTPLTLAVPQGANTLAVTFERNGYRTVQRRLVADSNQTIHVSLVADAPSAPAGSPPAASSGPPSSSMRAPRLRPPRAPSKPTGHAAPSKSAPPKAAPPAPSNKGDDWFRRFD